MRVSMHVSMSPCRLEKICGVQEEKLSSPDQRRPFSARLAAQHMHLCVGVCVCVGWGIEGREQSLSFLAAPSVFNDEMFRANCFLISCQ